MKKLLLLLSLITVFGCFSSFASIQLDEFPNPTANSSTYSVQSFTGNVTGVKYRYNAAQTSVTDGYKINSSKSSYFCNTSALENAGLSELKFTFWNDSPTKKNISVYGLTSAASDYASAQNGTVLLSKHSAAGEVTVDLTGYSYFAVVSTGFVGMKNISISWNVKDGEKTDYTPDWTDMTVYKGTTASLLSSTDHPNITFTSSNPAVASVDAEGVVSGLSNGTTEITASWTEDDTYSALGSPYTVTVTVTDRPLEKIWNITGTKGISGSDVDHDFITSGDPGTWHATHPGTSYVSGSQLGSTKNPFVGGTVSLIETDIPEDAYIKEVAMTVNSASTDGSSSWSLSVNDINAEGSLNFEGITEKTLSFNDVCIQGNRIKLTCTAAVKNLFISKLYVRYAEYTCPHAYETLTPSVKAEKTKTGYKLTFNNVPEGVEMYCKHTPDVAATRTVAHNEYTKATVNEDGTHSFEVSEFGNFSYYGYHPETDTKGMVKVEKIDLSTAVEAIASDSADVEMFNLNGVKVKATEAAAGIYIIRQGSKISKVVVK